MVKFCVAFTNMLESVSISLGLLKSDIEIIKATFGLKAKDMLQSLVATRQE